MTDNTQPSLDRLRIEPAKKSRRSSRTTAIVVTILVCLAVAMVMFFVTRGRDDRARVTAATAATTTGAGAAPGSGAHQAADVVLTVSGYIIPRERIEISPKFQATVRQILVRKGDRVNQGEVIVQLEDDEYQARVLEASGGLALARANLVNAEIELNRALELAEQKVDSQRVVDDARRARDAALAEVTTAEGRLKLAQTYLDWCTIRAPINGVVLEKLVEPNELVVPQSFGGDRGPSTAFISMADLNDLQVEIDLNEADVAKIRLNQRCRVSPEAFPDRVYQGSVTEIAPEANRQKGTLEVKVQVEKPDRYLTPELTAKVEFLTD